MDVGKPMDLFVFLFFHGERVHSWLTAHWSPSMMALQLTEGEVRENGTVVCQIKRVAGKRSL